MSTEREALRQCQRLLYLRKNVGNAAYEEQVKDAIADIDAVLAQPAPTVTLPPLPIYAWASVTQPLVIHHQVKDLWMKVSSKRVENYIEPLVLLEDVRAALRAAGVEVTK